MKISINRRSWRKSDQVNGWIIVVNKFAQSAHMTTMRPFPRVPFLPVYALRLFGSLLVAISPWRLCAFLLIATLQPMRAETVSWVGQSGDWSTATNWSTGSLPGPSDDVVIPAGSSITVTHSTGSDTVNSIVCHQPFTLSGGSLSVSNTFQTDNPLNLSGGTLTGATVATTSAGTLLVSSGTLERGDE